jgi:glycosyltransferase involved in cell wall biosynthesis
VRLAWCTPYTPESAIGRFSALVVGVLRQRSSWTVDIWYPQGAGGRLQPDPGAALTKAAARRLADYDAIVYNIGDHAPYHYQLVRLSRKYPGVLIVHDTSLNNLMLGEMLRMPKRDLERELRRWYGPVGERVADDILRDPGRWASRLDSVTNYPLSEFAVAAGTAVVTHSEHAAADLRRRYVGDVWRLPLPALHFEGAEVAEVDLPMLDDRTVILQAGVINANKCVPAIIDGFGLAGISDRAQLVIAGHASDKVLTELQHEIKRHKLADSVHLLGPVTDSVLHSLRRRAAVATVLRDPCLEAASAVLLDSMAYGLAVITVDAGHYVEVPDEAIVRVAVPPLGPDLAAAMTQLVDDPARAAALGERARDYVLSEHTPAVYAERIARVLREAGGAARRQQLGLDLARTLDRAGFTDDDEIADILARTAVELFSPEPRKAAELL